MGINTGLYRGFNIVRDMRGYCAKDCLPPDTTIQSPFYLEEDDTQESREIARNKAKKWIDDSYLLIYK